MSPESGNRFRDEDMREKREPEAHGANLKDRDTLQGQAAEATRMAARPLLIIGCGGHGRVVADAAREMGYDRIAFLDDAYRSFGASEPWRVLGPLDMMAALRDEWPEAIAASGTNARRLAAHRDLLRHGYVAVSIVHPSAVVSRAAHLGSGVFVAPAAVVNTGARIDDAVIVNTGARIDHDSVVEAGAHIAPGAILAGNVHVGQRTMLGAGSAVRQGVEIGADITVGVGAAVVSDLTAPGVYVGVPAAKLRDNR